METGNIIETVDKNKKGGYVILATIQSEQELRDHDQNITPDDLVLSRKHL